MTRPADDRSTFRYFAYGSNLWMPRMVERCPSARILGVASIEGWQRVYDKPSTDGSAKLNIRPDPESHVPGVVYEIERAERELLEAAEPGYTPVLTPVGLTFAYTGEPTTRLPFDWYVDLVDDGARSHGLQPPPAPDARAPGRPAAPIPSDPDPDRGFR